MVGSSDCPPIGDAPRVAQFVALKAQDALLGAAASVDVFEFAAMAAAPGDPIAVRRRRRRGPRGWRARASSAAATAIGR